MKKILLSQKVSKKTRKKEKRTKRALAALKVPKTCMSVLGLRQCNV